MKYKNEVTQTTPYILAIAAVLCVATIITPASAQVDIGNHNDLFTKLINAFSPVHEAINGNILYVAGEIQVLYNYMVFHEQQIDELKADVARLQASIDAISRHLNVTSANVTSINGTAPINGINGTNANMTNATTTTGGN